MMRFAVSLAVLLAAELLPGFPAAEVRAITITGAETGVPSEVSHACPRAGTHQCVDRLNPVTVEHLTGPSQSCQTAFGRDFPTWRPTYNWTQPWNGVLNISTYEARDWAVNPTHDGCVVEGSIDGMGALLKATYTPHVDDPDDPDDPPSDDITRFRWLQIIIANPPMRPVNPFVDPYPNDDTLPFYWKEGESPGGDYYFEDAPKRHCPCLGATSFRAELYLTDWYRVPGQEDKYLMLYDGIAWGFRITCVPEPPVLVMAVTASLLLVVRRTRRSA